MLTANLKRKAANALCFYFVSIFVQTHGSCCFYPSVQVVALVLNPNRTTMRILSAHFSQNSKLVIF